jgi:hypothetical protein
MCSDFVAIPVFRHPSSLLARRRSVLFFMIGVAVSVR